MTDHAPDIDLAELLRAAEDAPPAAAVQAVAEHLERRLGAESVRFWVADAAGQRLLSVPPGQQAQLAGTEAGAAWREQRTVEDSSIWVPVTVRGDALGVLEVRLPDAHPDGSQSLTDPMRAVLTGVAHCLGYVIVANQRHTDAYEVARRSEPFELSMEIQRRLLPQAYVCEGGSFALAGWLEPSSTAGGDTFDYIASRDRLTLSLIDAVGHDVRAAMLATLTVNAFRNARRGGSGLEGQAVVGQEALDRYADPEQYATGVLLELPLTEADEASPDDPRPTTARVINAGHPPPRLVRGAEASVVELDAQPPFGLSVRPDADDYPVQELELRPGDRLVLLTDGMYEQSAESFPLDELLVKTAHEHPRNAVQDIARAFRDHVGGKPGDDATLVLLDWYGGTTSRATTGGADSAG